MAQRSGSRGGVLLWAPVDCAVMATRLVPVMGRMKRAPSSANGLLLALTEEIYCEVLIFFIGGGVPAFPSSLMLYYNITLGGALQENCDLCPPAPMHDFSQRSARALSGSAGPVVRSSLSERHAS